MAGLKGFGSFLVITVVAFLGLRLLHIAAGIFFPEVVPGSSIVEDIGSVARHTGFVPRVPYYRPQKLGLKPASITVTRQPYPRVVIVWQAEKYLYLAEQEGGEVNGRVATAPSLPGHPESSWWREGSLHHVVFEQDDLWIEVRTDLSLEDLQRIVETLRPY
jgi:hypothetical protein